MTIAFHTCSVDPNTNVYTLTGTADERSDLLLSSLNGVAPGKRPGWDHPATAERFDTLTAGLDVERRPRAALGVMARVVEFSIARNGVP
jgi:hypothetical protein